MPLLGPAIRLFRSIMSGRQLDLKRRRLWQLSTIDPLCLIPASYAPCAQARLKIAQIEADPIVVSKGEGTREVVDALRVKGLEMAMEKAARELATRADIIRIVHKLDEYAGASQDSIHAVESAGQLRMNVLEGNMQNITAAFTSSEKLLQAQLDELSTQLKKYQMTSWILCWVCGGTGLILLVGLLYLLLR